MLCRFQNVRTKESVPWYGEFQNQRSEVLENTFNLHFNSTCTQEVWSLNQLYVYILEKIIKCPTTTYIPFQVLTKNFICFFPHNWLFNWANLLSLSNWTLVCGLEYDQKGTNKTVSPISLRLFYQLLTSPKLPLIIFNITI